MKITRLQETKFNKTFLWRDPLQSLLFGLLVLQSQKLILETLVNTIISLHLSSLNNNGNEMRLYMKLHFPGQKTWMVPLFATMHTFCESLKNAWLHTFFFLDLLFPHSHNLHKNTSVCIKRFPITVHVPFLQFPFMSCGFVTWN